MRLPLLLIALLLTGFSAHAEVRLPALISDGMVMQRETPVRIWGWAAPGEKITVAFNKQKKTAMADKQGRWQVMLKSLTAGGPFEMTVSGANTITVKDILVGEVWLASGQSNMEMQMNWPMFKRTEEIAQADWPQIREFNVAMATDITPHDQTAGTWQSCSPKSVIGFSAVGYFFARELHQRLHVPVGIIRSSWGGTAIDSWISRDGLQSEPVLKAAFDGSEEATVKVAKLPKELKLDDHDWMKPDFDDSTWKTIGLPYYWDRVLTPMEYNLGAVWARRRVELPEAWAGKRLRVELTVDDYETTYFNGQEIGRTTQHTMAVRSYEVPGPSAKAGSAVIAVRASKFGWGGIVGDPERLRLVQVDDPSQKISLTGEWKYAAAELSQARVSPSVPASVYNAMIAPITPFTIRGALWYQGEANASGASAFNYRKMLPTLIRDWRSKWHLGEFPFYFVQLPNLGTPSDNANGDWNWAVMRESQAEALALPNTGMAVTIDVGDAADIHPGNKWDVGKRLAMVALERTYAQKLHGRSPLFKGMTIEGGKIRIQFRNAENGLKSKDGATIQGFAIAGDDGKFVAADAVIDGTTVLVSSGQVPSPGAVRYAWADNPICNLYNQDGLPAAPFRANRGPTK